MGRSAFFSVESKRDGDSCKVVVRAIDNDAKQTLWGWGSDKFPSIEFYGRGTGRGVGDGEVYEWQLSEAAVSELRRNLQDQIRRPRYYEVTERENKAARQLLKKLERASCWRGSR